MRFLRQVLSLLSARQRRSYAALTGYFLFTAAVQAVGVASIAPFIALLSNPRLIHANEIARLAYARLGATSDREFLAMFAFGLMGLIILTNAVVAFSTWLIAAFSTRVGVELQQDIYRGLLHRDFAIFTRVNSADLISMITNDTNRFVYMVLQPLLNLLCQACIVLLVTVGLILYDPMVALSAGVIVGGGYLLIFGYLKKQIQRNGDIAWMTNATKLRILSESLGGIKEIKLAGTEAYYERELDAVSRAGLQASIRVNLYGDLPRFLLESIAFSALLALGVYLLGVYDEPQQVVGILSLYAMAGYKLLPAAQTIFKAASQIRANVNVARDIYPAVRDGRASQKAERVASEAVGNPDVFTDGQPIRFANVSYRYPETEQDVLRSVSFEVPPRAITVLVGASGAGKSTAADILLGLLEPTVGEVTVGDVPVAHNRRQWRQRLGYVAQSIFLLDDTIEANIAFGSPVPLDRDKIRRAADLAHVSEFAQAYPDGFGTRVGERGGLLSGGQRQRIGIARALYREAEVLVLDEATSALDARTEREIISTLAELKRTKTVVMVAHRLSTIQAADHILMFEKGRLVAEGSYAGLLERSDAFQRLIVGHSGSQELAQRDTLQIA